MVVSVQPPSQLQGMAGLWDSVLELTKSAQDKNCDPLLWAVQLSSSLNSAGVSLPSIELAQLLVSHICWDNHVPIMWKFLEKAMTAKIVPPLLVVALLSTRAIPYRKLRPAAYRLYLELLSRHVFSSTSQINGPNYQRKPFASRGIRGYPLSLLLLTSVADYSANKIYPSLLRIMQTIDDVLHLSQIFSLQACEPGLLMVELFFSIVWQLLDASLDDEGLLVLPAEERSAWLIRPQPHDMELDVHDSFSEKRTENSESLLKVNTAKAIEIIGQFLQNKKTARILYLAHRNMPLHWAGFAQRLQLLAANSAVLRNTKLITPEVLLHWTSDKHRLLSREGKTSQQEFRNVMASGSLFSSAGQSHGVNWSTLWLPIDLFLEDAMDGSQVLATSAVERLICLIKSLQAVNDTSWHNTFMGLWIAALRLIQRERDPSEGPVPRLDTCLCMLLSITTLAVTIIIEEDEGELKEEDECSPSKGRDEKKCSGKCRKGLITSLQMLGEYEGLLTPPQSVTAIANQAAAKAVMFISGVAVGNEYYDCVSMNDTPVNCSGNMRHLIVEACISRNLLDTSVYFWPGYVNARSSQVPRSASGQVVGWSSFMKGSSLTLSMVDALVATPASSLAEIEKIYEIAVNGSGDEKISAASILCGESLVRGWNLQEHTVLFIARLLSPPIPADYSGSDSYLIDYAPFLNVLLVGISSVDCVQIFSLHGMVPLLAGQLMPICEAFGLSPPKSWVLTSGEELTCHAVFSLAFTLLLRLWRFHHPPVENVKRDARPVGSQLTPEYLLLVRNSQLASFGKSPKDRFKVRRLSKLLKFSLEPIFMDSFPKLKGWYRQHQECIASILSGLVPGAPVHQIVDALLTMMFRKINRGGHSLTSTTSGSSNSSGSANEEASIKLKVPAWDILEATPFVLDAALTACAHGRLSPRDLATGLKDLADFLPASFATIVSYFSAEVTRGIWKPAFMNGTDWPSPAATLSIVEQQIKKILAATGVDVPSLAVGGNSPAMLPLPLAALISLTITYKLDKASERLLALVGPALNTLAASCSWPCTPIIASLWAQKVKRWNDFLVFSASRTVFHHNSDAVVQLLKSCFTSTLGLGNSNLNSNGGVGTLLGHGFGSHVLGGMSPVAPGILYLRVHRSVRDALFMVEEIVSLLMLSVRDIAVSGLPREKAEKLKKTKHGMRYEQVSFASAMSRVKLAASLGASLVWISGGSGLVQSLFKETLPSWFLSVHSLEREGVEYGGMVAVLGGYALAFFSVLCGTFSWGIDSVSSASKRRAKILDSHLEFLASALDGKFSIGCDWATWRAYVSGFVSLMVRCAPKWVVEVDVNILKRLSNGLRQLSEEELALALLESGGVTAMGAAAELIIEGGF